jgi:hypothetical protein
MQEYWTQPATYDPQQFSFWLRQGFEIANGHLLGLRWYPLEPRRQDDASLTLR